jgi:hypothetical protein
MKDVGLFYQSGGHHRFKKASASWKSGIKLVCMASLESIIRKYYCT